MSSLNGGAGCAERDEEVRSLSSDTNDNDNHSNAGVELDQQKVGQESAPKRKMAGGKRRRWITVFGAFIVVAIYDGTLATTGVMMPTILNKFETSRTMTSLLGPVIYGLPMFLGPVVCCLVTVFGCRPVALVGAAVLGCSFVLSGFVYSSFGLLFLTMGVLRSIGASFMYSPSFIILPYWFPNSKRLGLAAGVAVCGSGFGGFVLPPLLQYLLTEYGWTWALVMFGGICFNALIGCMLFKLPAYDEPDELSSQGEDQEFDSVDAFAQLSKSDADLDTIGDLMEKSPLKRVSSRDMYAALYKCTISTSRAELIGAYLRDAAKSQARAAQLRREREERRVEGTSSLRSLSLPNVRLGIGLTMPDGVPTGSSPIPSKSDTSQTNETCSDICGRLKEEFRENILKIFDRELFTNKRFVLFLLCNTFVSMWDSVPDFFLIDFAQTNMGLTAQSASFIPSVIGITSVVGQIIVGFISDHRGVNRVLIYALCLFSGAAVIFCLPLVNGPPALYVLAGVYGFFFMSNYGMQSPILFKIVGIERLAGAFGVVQFFQGMANSIGIPFTGYLVDITGSFYIPFLCCAFFFAFAGCLLVGSVLSSVRCERACSCFFPQQQRAKSSMSLSTTQANNNKGAEIEVADGVFASTSPNGRYLSISSIGSNSSNNHKGNSNTLRRSPATSSPMPYITEV